MKSTLLLGTQVRRWALALSGLLGSGTLAHSQALNYATAGATNVAGTFASIAGTGTAIATANTDDANSAARNIGFTFAFNGASFTQFVLNTNGFIKLGSAAPSSAALFFTPENTLAGDVFSSTDAADVNIVAAFNCDLESGTRPASYQVLTSGTTGSRVCTIQWTNVHDKLITNTPQYENFSFQVKLYEGSNRVELVYGTATAGTGTGAFRYAGSGIKGSGNASGQTVLFTKASSQAWSLATPLTGVYTGNALNYRQTVLPDAGRTLRFDPQAANDAAVSAVYTLGQLSQTYASPHVVRAVVSNNGTSATTSRLATLAVTGANTFSNTQTVPALAVGASATVTFTAYPATNLGTNTVTVSIPADDNGTNNAASSQQVVSAGKLAYADPATALTNGLGSGAANSLLFVKYRTNSATVVSNITPNFFATTTASTFQVEVYDASGAGGLPGSTPLYTSATQNRPTTAGPVSVTVPNVAVTGDFYVATRQLTATNISLGYQTESPLRAGTFLFSADGVAFTDLSTSTFPARLAIETTLGASTATGPANNECATATSLTSGTTCVPTSGTTVGATQSLPAIACGGFTGTADDDVWYRFTASSATHAVTVVGDATFDAVVDVRSGSCPGVNIGCADAAGDGGTEVVNLTGLTAGQTYYVRVYSYVATATGTFTICVTNGAVAVCANPTDVALANITNTSAQVTFTPAAGNTGYTVTYTPTGGTATTVTPTPTTSPITISGLTPGTAYALTFQSVCAAGGTAPVLAGSFTTTNTGATPPANDNPTGATVLTVSAACAPTSSTNAGATTTLPNGYVNPSATPATCGIAVNPKDVWFRFTTLAGQTAATVTVAGTAAGQIRVFAAATSAGPFTQIGCAAGTANNTQSAPVSLTGLTGGTTYYVAVAGYGSGDTQGAFTICVTGTGFVPCPAVTGLSVGNITTTSANLTFTPASGATNYSVSVTTAGSGPTITVSGSPVSLTSLQPATTYTVSIVTNCVAGQTSPAVTTTFTTATPPCPAITGLSAGSLTTTGATLTFTPAAGAASYVLTLTPQGGTPTTRTVTGSPVVLTGLTPSTAYTASVVTSCTTGLSSPAVSTTFTTATPPCPAVTGLGAGSVTATTATLTFTPAAGAASYAVTLTPQGGTATTQTVTASPVNLTGLTPGTLYTVRVVTSCTTGLSSPAATTTFTTNCPAVTGLAAGSITTTGATLTFTPAAGATGYTVTVNGTALTTPTTGSPVVLTGLTPTTAYTVTVTTICSAGSSTSATVTFITTTPPCPAITGLSAGSVTATGATLTFTPAAGAANYVLTLTPQGGAATTQTVTGSPVNLTGLTPSTAYSVSIVTSCTTGLSSPAVTTTFTTATPPCVAVTGLTTGSVTDTGASLTFTPTATGVSYVVTVTPQGGTATTQTVTASPVNLTGLAPGTTYAVSVVTSCGAGQASPAATTSFVTTAPAPTNATVSNITSTDATITFTPAAGAASYTVTYTPQGGAPVTITVTGSPFVLTGLTALTNYSVAIVANYPGGAASNALVITFQTLLGTGVRATLAGGLLLVYPNPAHHAFTLSLPALGAARTARLELVNALGQTLRTQTIALSSTGTTTQVDVTGLATGLYVVRVKVGAETATTRLSID